MEELGIGSTGPLVELLQHVLTERGLYDGIINGVYNSQTFYAIANFQKKYGLNPNGIVNQGTWAVLMPFINGYDVYTIQKDDSVYEIAAAYGTTVNRIMIANPQLDVNYLQIGQKIIVPFKRVVLTNIRYTYEILMLNIEALKKTYPFLEQGNIGRSVLLRNIPYLKLGNGEKQVFYSASYHANEWITSLLMMKFIEEFALAYTNESTIYGYHAADIFNNTSIYIVPMVNPDGVNLVTGAYGPGTYAYDHAREISSHYPDIPFPKGWKANIEGIDLNLQFPAGWEVARDNKYRLGFISPAPRDYVGSAPLVASEAIAVSDFTIEHDFALIIAYHTQGEVIYWRYLDYLPDNSFEIGQQFSQSSGYRLEETPFISGFAGYKDWFIQTYNRPGYTIEAGRGATPIPLSQFDTIYRQNEGILVLGAVLA